MSSDVNLCPYNFTSVPRCKIEFDILYVVGRAQIILARKGYILLAGKGNVQLAGKGNVLLDGKGNILLAGKGIRRTPPIGWKGVAILTIRLGNIFGRCLILQDNGQYYFGGCVYCTVYTS